MFRMLKAVFRRERLPLCCRQAVQARRNGQPIIVCPRHGNAYGKARCRICGKEYPTNLRGCPDLCTVIQSMRKDDSSVH